MGRKKGNVAEREVAALCEEWWRRLEPVCEFVRTPLSGGWSTATVREHFKAAGDLMTTALWWPWCVEVKRREAWDPENVIRGLRSPVWAWWAQACTDAETAKRRPMLWLRRNREGWWVMLQRGQVVDCPRVPDPLWILEPPKPAPDPMAEPVIYTEDALLAGPPILWLPREKPGKRGRMELVSKDLV